MELYEYEDLTRHDNDVYTVTAVIKDNRPSAKYGWHTYYINLAIFDYDAQCRYAIYAGEYGDDFYAPKSSKTHKKLYELIKTWWMFTDDDIDHDIVIGKYFRKFKQPYC